MPLGRRPAHRGRYAGSGPRATPHSHPQLRQSLLYAVASTERERISLERASGNGAEVPPGMMSNRIDARGGGRTPRRSREDPGGGGQKRPSPRGGRERGR